jgi:hypothetical protein
MPPFLLAEPLFKIEDGVCAAGIVWVSRPASGIPSLRNIENIEHLKNLRETSHPFEI